MRSSRAPRPLIALPDALLSRAEQSIAGVAEAGYDVPLRIQLAINRRADDRHIGMRGTQASNPFRRRDDAHERDPLRASLLQ